MATSGPSFSKQFLRSGFANFSYRRIRRGDNSKLRSIPHKLTKSLCKFRMDKILAEYADQAYETARLGRNGVQTTRDLVSRKNAG